MKVKVTQRVVREGFRAVMVGDYNPLERIINRYLNANFYTCGVYGWNADIYTFGRVAFVCGYRPFGEPIPEAVSKKFARRIKFLKGSDYSRQNVKKAERLLLDIANEIATNY